MRLDTKDVGDGNQSLELSAANHIACTGKVISVSPGKYVFSFDYQSPNADVASFYVGFDDPLHTVITKSLPIPDTSWHQYTTELTVSKGVSLVNLILYAHSVDGTTTIVNRYDAVSLQRLTTINTVDLSAASDFTRQTIKLPIATSTVSYTDTHYTLTNLLSNGSFEQGLWGAQVGDCNNYDDNPIIGMQLNTRDASDGKQSLELNVTRHIACTSTNTNVHGGSTYLVSFDYQSPNAQAASYYVGFNDASSTSFSDDVPITDSKWHTFSTIVTAPLDASGLNLVLYAKESDGSTNIINRYDNVRVVEVPNLAGSYYMVGDPGVKLAQPASTTFELISPTKKLVHITGATTGFYLAFSESYHPQWLLELNNSKVQGLLNGWWPFAKPDTVSNPNHFELDDFLNGWYVDPAVLCVNADGTLRQGCTKNDDGGYNIEMIIEFAPQRWFYLGLLISGTTLLACLGYLSYLVVGVVRKKYYGRI